MKVWWKIRNKIKGRYITYSHIWHVDISKCVYWLALDTHSVKVWWLYVLLKVNATHFWNPVKKTVLEIKNSAPLGSTRIIYLTFSKYSRSLHKWCKQERGHKQATTHRQNYWFTLRHPFLRFVWNLFIYMVYFGLGPFFGNQKNVYICLL